jgi:hypothetical protein
MNRATLRAFLDELESIDEDLLEDRTLPGSLAYDLRKEANWLTGITTGLVNHGRTVVNATRGLATQGVTRVVPGDTMRGDLVNTLAAFTRPLKSLKEGWNYGGEIVRDGVKKYAPASEVPGKGWLGVGKQLTPDADVISRVGENITTLGGATKYLPVGPKSLTVGIGAATLPGAVSAEDQTGEGRSRTERIGRWAGNMAGGLIGAPHGLPGALGGSVIGEQLGGAPGKLLKKRKKLPEELPQAAPQQGSVAPSPDMTGASK